MSIDGIGATYGTSLWELLYGGQRKENRDAIMSLGNGGADTATFSAEAMTMLEAAQKPQTGQDNSAGSNAGKQSGSVELAGANEGSDADGIDWRNRR